MKPINAKLRLLALAAGSLAISMAGANAAPNSSYAAGDLVLYFQQEGSTNTVYVDLGNAANVFRGTATGPDAPNALNIIDIHTQLNAAFGSWTSATNLYMGVAGVFGTSATNNTPTNGDPQRTIYVGQGRNSAGTVGQANSTGYDLTLVGNTAMTTGAGDITSMLAPFADASGANGYNGPVVSATSGGTASAITATNPFLSAGIQGTAFSIFGGGVQQVGTAGTFASSFGNVSNVEFAIDLYRIEAKNTIGGQVGNGEALRVGTFEGTITLDSIGNVSFQTQAVPEPSSCAMFSVAVLVIGFVAARRRKIAE